MSVQNLVSALERWMVSKCTAQTEYKRKLKVNGECTVKDKWMQDERFIRSASGVILTLCFVGNQKKITNKLHIYIVISLNIIWLNDKLTMNEWWVQDELLTNGEHKVKTLWMHGECFGNRVEQRAQVNTPWTHSECTKKVKVERFRDCTWNCLTD